MHDSNKTGLSMATSHGEGAILRYGSRQPIYLGEVVKGWLDLQSCSESDSFRMDVPPFDIECQLGKSRPE